VAQIDESLVIAKVKLEQIKEQNLNARYMPQDMFKQLTRNIEKRGTLESLPYCALQPDGIEVMSGHHRLRALRAAKYQKSLWILLETKPLTRDQIRAKQLAHNSIQGFDDTSILREIYLGIQDADQRIQAFIDESKLEIPQPPSIQITPLNTGLDFQNVKLLFLPTQLKDFDRILNGLDGDETAIYCTDMANWELFKQAVLTITKKDNIHSIGSSVARMAELALERLEQIEINKEIDKLCDKCKPEFKQHCLTPGDPSPLCVADLIKERRATR
jgi:hypothetical protein